MVALRIFAAFLLALFKGSEAFLPGNRPGFPPVAAVVGGSAVQEPVPYLASLRLPRDGDHYCAGTLITPNAVLTAAHCVDDGRVPWVHIGRVGRVGNDGSGFEAIKAERVVLHPKYNSGVAFNNDAAILFLSQSSSKSTVLLATDDSCFEANGRCTVVLFGWGKTTEGGSAANILQKAKTSSISREDCQALLPWDTITDVMICAGEIGGGIDTCQGDSGGPMIQDGKQVGIVSWGRGCAREESPGVYASVPKLRSWILSELAGAGTGSTVSPSPVPVVVPSPSPSPTAVIVPGSKDDECDCSSDGVSGGVATNRAGCKQHLISTGDTDYFCMVKGGPACSSAQPSDPFPGAAWKFCEPYDVCACTEDGISGGVQTNRIGCAQHLIQFGDYDRFCMVVGGSSCSSAKPSEAFPGATWKLC